MNKFFICKNGQNISWRLVCDGDNQCIDGSDEEYCYCQGDIYACLQGNNVSCRLACATYGRVTCLTYQNTRACEQYNQQSITRQLLMNSTSESSILMSNFNTFQYSISLSIGILLLLSILLMLIIYLIRKKTSIQKSRSIPSSDIYDFPPSYYYYSDQSTSSINDLYEPPPYPGSLSSLSSLSRSDSIYYETIRTLSISSSESNEFPNIRRHCV